jgi:hypothetical protein
MRLRPHKEAKAQQWLMAEASMTDALFFEVSRPPLRRGLARLSFDG